MSPPVLFLFLTFTGTAPTYFMASTGEQFMAIFAGFTSYVVLVTKALSITYITGKNWISLLSEYNLNPYDELQFGLTKTPQLVLLAFKRNEEKNFTKLKWLRGDVFLEITNDPDLGKHLLVVGM